MVLFNEIMYLSNTSTKLKMSDVINAISSKLFPRFFESHRSLYFYARIDLLYHLID